VPEAVILVGIPGGGKSTFYRERFQATHAHISLDELKTRARERTRLEECIAAGRSFVVDNTNTLAAERAVYIEAAKRAGYRVIGYFFDIALREAQRRNAKREGRAKIPPAGVGGMLKRLQRPELSEGFDELIVLTQRNRIFLLSPAFAGGKRAQMLMRSGATFGLAVKLRREGLPLGEAFEFMSGLYFRGKLAYARAFAAPPPDIPGSFVITAGSGLVPPETVITIEQLEYIASIPIDEGDARYREPLEKACRTLDEIAGPNCDFVLLGSVATVKYLEPMQGVFGDRLLFPEEFIGRGDMSRGGLMLRCARAGVPLTYVPVGKVTRHGPRPPKLPPWRRQEPAS
jgi:predicted kinase